VPVGKKQINCEVVIPKSRRHGIYANAFRVLPDGAEYLLDFLVYSQQESSALVVTRLRVTPAVLSAIRDRLSSSMTEVLKDANPVFVAKGSEEVH
jgi:hypothetical protein